MADLTIEKKKFDMKEFIAKFSELLKLKNIDNNNFNKLQLVTEEYLNNILFPNFDGMAEISITNDDKELSLVFTHEGINYMNKITDNNFLSLKILDNKTKEIESNTADGITSVKFIF